MALDASNAAVAVSGEVFVGAYDAPVPTGVDFDPTADGNYMGLGYLSEDGFEITPESSSENLVGWQNAAVLRSIITEASITATFTMVEVKESTIETYWATTVDTTTGSYDVDPAATGGKKKWIFQVIDGDEAELACYVGELSGREAITNQNGQLIGYGVTITFTPDPAFGGKTGRVFNTRLVAPTP